MNRVVGQARWILQACRERGLPAPPEVRLADWLGAEPAAGQALIEDLEHLLRGADDRMEAALVALARVSTGPAVLAANPSSEVAVAPTPEDRPTPVPRRVQRSAPEPRPTPRTFHIYGRRYALALEAATVRTPLAAGVEHTVQFEMAAAVGNGEAGFDWGHKTVVQLMVRQLVPALAAVMGYCDRFQADHHGERHDKSLSIVGPTDREPQLLVAVSQPPFVGRVPVPAEDLALLVDALLTAILRNHPALSADGALELSRRVGSLLQRRQTHVGKQPAG